MTERIEQARRSVREMQANGAAWQRELADALGLLAEELAQFSPERAHERIDKLEATVAARPATAEQVKRIISDLVDRALATAMEADDRTAALVNALCKRVENIEAGRTGHPSHTAKAGSLGPHMDPAAQQMTDWIEERTHLRERERFLVGMIDGLDRLVPGSTQRTPQGYIDAVRGMRDSELARTKERDEAIKQRDEYADTIIARNTRITELQTELERIKQTRTNLERTCTELRADLEAVKSQAAQETEAVDMIADLNEYACDERDKLKHELETVRIELAQAVKDRDEWGQRARDAEADLEREQRDTPSKRRSRFVEEEHERKVQALRDQLESATTERDAAQASNATLQNQLGTGQLKRTEQRKTIEDQARQITELREQLRTEREQHEAEIHRQHANRDSDFAEGREQNKRLIADNQELRIKAHEAEERAKAHSATVAEACEKLEQANEARKLAERQCTGHLNRVRELEEAAKRREGLHRSVATTNARLQHELEQLREQAGHIDQDRADIRMDLSDALGRIARMVPLVEVATKAAKGWRNEPMQHAPLSLPMLTNLDDLKAAYDTYEKACAAAEAVATELEGAEADPSTPDF